jgi:hypothetical protein
VLRSGDTLANSSERWVLDALRDINKMSGTSPANIINRVLALAKHKSIDIEHLAKLALRGEPPSVRALIGAIGECIGISKDLLMRLHHSLNSSTFYKIRVGDNLSTARNWKIIT